MAGDNDSGDRPNDHFRKAFALVVVALFSVLFVRMIAPFLQALLLAIVLSGLTYPLFCWLDRHSVNRVVAAGATTLLILLAIVMPLTLVAGAFSRQAINLSERIVPWIEQQAETARIAFEWPDWLPFAGRIDGNELLMQLADALNQSGSFFVSGVGSVTQTAFMFVLQLAVMLYVIFHLLLAGPRLASVFDYTPLTETDRRVVIERGVSITRATLKVTLVVGVMQGALAGAAFAVVGIPGPIFWSVIMAILSAVPGVGAALVWVPAVGVLLFRGELVAGIALGVWCTLVVSTIDNLVRPYLLGNDTQMSPVLVLLSTLGGIAMFGAPGIIIGPLLAGFFLTSWDIFGAAFRRELTDSTAPPLAAGEAALEASDTGSSGRGRRADRDGAASAGRD